MPSYFESLSMVALEAWALGKPVLANGRCDVLKGQCIRSNGGLYYDNFAEFMETLRAIDFNPSLAAALGRNGRDYFQRHYTWPIIERKYLDMLERLKREPSAAALEPLPGWFARRRKTLPPADEVVAQLPRGAVLERQRCRRRRASGRSPGASRGVSRTSALTAADRDRPARQRRRRRAARRRATGGRPGHARPARTRARPQQARRRAAAARRQQRRRRPGGRPPRRPGNR